MNKILNSIVDAVRLTVGGAMCAFLWVIVWAVILIYFKGDKKEARKNYIAWCDMEYTTEEDYRKATVLLDQLIGW